MFVCSGVHGRVELTTNDDDDHAETHDDNDGEKDEEYGKTMSGNLSCACCECIAAATLVLRWSCCCMHDDG